jgi:chemotaxis protein histidine kinase CheA
MSYAEALEEEGTFGDVAKRAWQNASQAWYAFGEKNIPEPGSTNLFLGHLEKYEKKVQDAVAELNALEPGLHAKIHEEKFKTLTDQQRSALETPADKRTDKEIQAAAQAEAQLEISTEEIANRVPAEKRAQAKKLAAVAQENELIAVDIRRSRDIVNFAYWKLRSEVEQEEDALAAREAIFKGTLRFREAANVAAKELFHEGFLKWRSVIDRYPKLLDDSITVDDLMDDIKIYRRILDQLNEQFPDVFILQDVLKKHAENK